MNKIKKVNEYFSKDNDLNISNDSHKDVSLEFLSEVGNMLKQFNNSTGNLDDAYDGLCSIMSKYMEISEFKEFLKQFENK